MRKAPAIHPGDISEYPNLFGLESIALYSFHDMIEV